MLSYDSDTTTSDFIKASEQVHKLKNKPNDDDLLVLYGFYKQATQGNYRETEKPGIFDLKGQAKWNAWKRNKGMSRSEGMVNYIKFVEQLKRKYGY